MLTIDKLREFGANTDEGIARCANSEMLYLRLVKMVPNEANFENLKNALEADDLDGAFAAAHALKGVLGNLSLGGMYDLCAEITDLLRTKEQVDYAPMLSRLLEMRDALSALCEE